VDFSRGLPIGRIIRGMLDWISTPIMHIVSHKNCSIDFTSNCFLLRVWELSALACHVFIHIHVSWQWGNSKTVFESRDPGTILVWVDGCFCHGPSVAASLQDAIDGEVHRCLLEYSYLCNFNSGSFNAAILGIVITCPASIRLKRPPPTHHRHNII